MRYHVADIGGSHITCAIAEVTPSGAKILERVTVDVDSHDSADNIMDAWAAACRQLPGATAWTLAMPDPFDYETGLALFEGVGKFENLYNVNVRDGLTSRLDIEPSRIKFIHDATAYAIGEWAFGKLAGAHRMIVLTLGTGVGSGFLVDGVPVKSGPNVVKNGTIHLDTIDGRPLEDVVSTRAITAKYRDLTGSHASVEQIAQLVRNGEAEARAVFNEAVEKLGGAMAHWVEVFEAEALVLGGSIAKSWDIIETPFKAGLGLKVNGLALQPATLFDDAPLMGAVYRTDH
ncbi:MAG: ROK family protein [Micrococcales bacterium]